MYVWNQGAETDAKLFRGDSLGRAEVTLGAASKWVYGAILARESVSMYGTASEGYVVVDKSDTTNFLHTNTDKLYLRKLNLDAEMTAATRAHLKIGLVGTNDAGDGDIYWFHTFHIGANSIVHEEVDLAAEDPRGICMDVSSSKPAYFLTNDKSLADARFSTGASLTSPAGTSSPGAGDIVAYLNVVGGGAAGELYLTLRAEYSDGRNETYGA
jgi:hypothetical protein